MNAAVCSQRKWLPGWDSFVLVWLTKAARIQRPRQRSNHFFNLLDLISLLSILSARLTWLRLQRTAPVKLRSAPPIVVPIKYTNTLPPIPFPPKFLPFPFDPMRCVLGGSQSLLIL